MGNSEDYESLRQKYIELSAEYANYRKRTQKEKEQLTYTGGKHIVQAILPAIDDLERAISHIVPVDDKDSTTFQQGVCLAYIKLMKALSSQGVKPIKARGCSFSPDIHQAIGMADGDANIVTECAQTGYSMNEELIRPSKVIVGNGKKTK